MNVRSPSKLVPDFYSPSSLHSVSANSSKLPLSFPTSEWLQGASVPAQKICVLLILPVSSDCGVTV